MSFAFVPLYVKYLGIEAYGLIGFYVTLQAVLSLLDLGLSTTLNRELARRSARNEQGQQTRDLVRTLELVYISVAILISVLVVILAPFIAKHWVNVENIPLETVENAIISMGVALAFQWPLSFYSGGLAGLQRLGLQNALLAGLATLRGVGAVMVLLFVSNTITAYFIWQVVISFLGTTTMALALWYLLPSGYRKSRFKKEQIFSVWKFTTGVLSISVVSILLTQVDKIILSTWLSMEMYGYYMLATVVGSAILHFVSPAYAAFFPRFSQLVAVDDSKALATLYHRASQFVSVVIFPTIIVLSLFSYEVMVLWTGSQITAENTYLLVSILVIGFGVNGIMHIPFALQLAFGWTQLAFYINLIAVFVLVPLLIVMANLYGALGAAFIWTVLNISYVFVAIPVMHGRLLKGEQWRWYREDFGAPLLAALGVAGMGKWLFPDGMEAISTIIYIIIVSCVTVISTVIVAPQIRGLIKHLFCGLKSSMHGFFSKE